MDCIKDMLKSENVVVRTEAAAYCLALNDNVDTAVEALSEISGKKENGILGFNAKMTLEVWREEGCLQIYQKKEK